MSTATVGSQLKLIGLERAESAHKESLDAAKFLAEMLGHKQNFVTVDDVFKYINPKALGNAAGAIFRSDSWEFVGWVPSWRESNHARPVRSWRLRA